MPLTYPSFPLEKSSILHKNAIAYEQLFHRYNKLNHSLRRKKFINYLSGVSTLITRLIYKFERTHTSTDIDSRYFYVSYFYLRDQDTDGDLDLGIRRSSVKVDEKGYLQLTNILKPWLSTHTAILTEKRVDADLNNIVPINTTVAPSIEEFFHQINQTNELRTVTKLPLIFSGSDLPKLTAVPLIQIILADAVKKETYRTYNPIEMFKLIHFH